MWFYFSQQNGSFLRSVYDTIFGPYIHPNPIYTRFFRKSLYIHLKNLAKPYIYTSKIFACGGQPYIYTNPIYTHFFAKPYIYTPLYIMYIHIYNIHCSYGVAMIGSNTGNISLYNHATFKSSEIISNKMIIITSFTTWVPNGVIHWDSLPHSVRISIHRTHSLLSRLGRRSWDTHWQKSHQNWVIFRVSTLPDT